MSEEPSTEVQPLMLAQSRTVDVGTAGYTPKTVLHVPQLLPTEFFLDGDAEASTAQHEQEETNQGNGACEQTATRRVSSRSADPRKSSRRASRHAKKAAAGSGRSYWTGLRTSISASDLSTIEVSTPPNDALESSAVDDVTRNRGMCGMKRKVNSAPNLRVLNTVSDRSVFRPITAHYALDSSTIGTGGYAVVKKIVSLESGTEYAVKIMPIGARLRYLSDSENSDVSRSSDDDCSSEGSDSPDPLTFDEIMNEIELVQKLSHPNVVNIHEYFVNRSTCYIVMDLLQGPELMEALQMKDKYTEADVRLIMGRLLDAVSYMHVKGVTHRDIKLENIVLAKKNDLSTVTIVDFGLAKAARAREKMQDICGTIYYYAPEIVDAKPYGPAVDEWALGVSMYILLTGSYPFYDEDEDELCLKIVGEELELTSSVWQLVSNEAKEVLHGLLAKDPRERLLAGPASDHSWFTGLAGHNVQTLHDVHELLQKFVLTTGLPRRHFKAGQFLSSSLGENECSSDEVYLLDKGECEVLVAIRGTAHAARRIEDYAAIGTRRKGDFVGEITMSVSERQLEHVQQRRQLPASYDDPEKVEPDTDASSEALQSAGACCLHPEMSQQQSDRSTICSTDFKHSVEFGHCEPVSPQTGACNGETTLNISSKTPLSPTSEKVEHILRQAAGTDRMPTDRTVAFRALTAVTAYVLHREDMQWAVEHDYRLGSDLQKAVHARRRELRMQWKNSPETSPTAAVSKLRGNPFARSMATEAHAPISGSSSTPQDCSAQLEQWKLGLGAGDRRAQFRRGCNDIITEYFSSADIGEVAARLPELQLVCGDSESLSLFVKRAVSLAIDRTARESERVSVLLSGLCPGILDAPTIQQGFGLLVRAVDDLAIDVPEAPALVALFLARAVLDELLPPAFVTSGSCGTSGGAALDAPPPSGVAVCAAARTLITARHGAARVLAAWGGGEAGTSTHSKREIRALLEEYIYHRDPTEACRCLRELRVPYYHHEAVKQLLTIAIERHASERPVLCQLLQTLHATGVVSSTQLHLGVERTSAYVEEHLSVDVPGASSIFSKLLEDCAAAGLPMSGGRALA